MLEKTVAVGYTQALFELARAQGNLQQTKKDLEKVVELLRANPELTDILLHPAVPRDRKMGLINSLLVPHLSAPGRLVKNFLFLIIDKRREKILKFIMKEYKLVADLVEGIVPATVQTAIPLAEPKLDRLKERLEKLSEKKIEIRTEITPGILGGVIIRVGNRVIDGSVANRLKNLRRRLMEMKSV